MMFVGPKEKNPLGGLSSCFGPQFLYVTLLAPAKALSVKVSTLFGRKALMENDYKRGNTKTMK
jgi:hypothetical protein